MKNKITLLKENPFMSRKLYYFVNKVSRDLIYQGYTIIYKTELEHIVMLEKQDR